MNNKKIELGQFFTVSSIWLKQHIKDFINNCNCSIAYDPFAGEGSLLNIAINDLGFSETKGLDIDDKLGWNINDSLINIPHIDKAMIITNPPYLANFSATKKGMNIQYFQNSNYSNLYLIALEKCLEAQDYVVAIIPTSFFTSNFKHMNRLHSITKISDNIFSDTKASICIACFDNIKKDYSQIKMYKDDKYISTLKNVLYKKALYEPSKKIKIKFNDLNGWIGIKTFDDINIDFKNNIDYKNWNILKNKNNGKMYNLVNIEMEEDKKILFINECKNILNIILKDKCFEFYGYNYFENTRFRMKLSVIRYILETAYDNIMKEEITN